MSNQNFKTLKMLNEFIVCFDTTCKTKKKTADAFKSVTSSCYDSTTLRLYMSYCQSEGKYNIVSKFQK